jgi:hypothetical protein
MAFKTKLDSDRRDREGWEPAWSPNIRARRTWGTLKPVTKVKQSKKIYRRNNRPTEE